MSDDELWRHSWEVSVEIRNEGSVDVQLMTRHTVATTATGRVEESKLPGAFGKAPILVPGERFAARGRTAIESNHGSLHGSYQFEVVSPSTAGTPHAFSANMGRFLLSDGTRRDGRVPCVPEADVMSRELPPTSVYTSHRIVAGATIVYLPQLSDADLSRHTFMYDVQLQNARDAPVVVHGREWTFLDARGVPHVESDVGLGGTQSTGKIRIPQGRGTRHQGTFELPTVTGIAAGRFVVTLDEGDPDHTTYEVTVAPMGVSIDGRAVPPIEPAGFLL